MHQVAEIRIVTCAHWPSAHCPNAVWLDQILGAVTQVEPEVILCRLDSVVANDFCQHPVVQRQALHFGLESSIRARTCTGYSRKGNALILIACSQPCKANSACELDLLCLRCAELVLAECDREVDELRGCECSLGSPAEMVQPTQSRQLSARTLRSQDA
eukprot:5245763-Amphidinium_carterae.1